MGQPFRFFLLLDLSLLTLLALRASYVTFNSYVKCICYVMYRFSHWQQDRDIPDGSKKRPGTPSER